MTSKLGFLMALAVVAASSASGSTERGSSPFPSGWIVTPMVKVRGGIEDIELFRIRIDGTGLHRMTNGPGNVTDPSFAPNGKRVVFARTGRGLFSIGLDGTGLHQLTLYAYDQYPVYSPDGKRVAFLRGDRLWVMQSDGSRQRLLRRAPRIGARSSWSPDGRKIAVERGEWASDFLYTLDARTGRVLRRMLLIEGDLAGGSFSGALLAPNGRTVVFEAYRPTPPDCKGIECDAYALYRRPLGGDITSTRVVCNDCSAMAWSADSRVLLITRKNGHLELRVVRDGRTKAVDFHGAQPRGTPTLQPR